MEAFGFYLIAASGFSVFFIVAVVVSAVLGLPLLGSSKQPPVSIPPPWRDAAEREKAE